MEKLSTECLLGLKERIDSILKGRKSEEDELGDIGYDESLSQKERQKLYLDQFEAYIEEFNKLFPLFLEDKRRWLTANNVYEYYLSEAPKFDTTKWNIFMKKIEDNKIFIPHVFV